MDINANNAGDEMHSEDESDARTGIQAEADVEIGTDMRTEELGTDMRTKEVETDMQTDNDSETRSERRKLARTIAFASDRLERLNVANEYIKNGAEAARRELMDHTTRSFTDLYNTDEFDNAVEMSQFFETLNLKIKDYHTVAKEIAMLEKMINSPYFARVDFVFEGEAKADEIYIGRSSLRRDETGEMLVFDWRSPIAGVFYRFATGPAFYEAPAGKIRGNVALKRQFEIINGRLEFWFDADYQVLDEFMRKILSQNAAPKMKAIVETIQKDQDAVVRDAENDLVMVQGAAGSGKTSVALHRAAYLLYQGASSGLSANNIMIISPNEIFEDYISSVLPELGEDNVTSVVFDELLTKILRENPNRMQPRYKFLESITSRPGRGGVMKSSVGFKNSAAFIEILDRYIADAPNTWLGFGDVVGGGRLLLSREELRRELSSYKASAPLKVKLEMLEEFIWESVSPADGEAKIKKPGKTELARIKSEAARLKDINYEQIYHRLFEDAAYLRELAQGLDLPDDMDDIIRYTRENFMTGQIMYDDASAIAYLRLKINRSDEFRGIRQVVIDEAQDYYTLQYKLFGMLFTGAKFTILGDVGQALEKAEDISLYDRIRDILSKRTSRLYTLEKSFRSTTQIINFSSAFLPGGAEIKSFGREGREPQIYAAADWDSLRELIASGVASCAADGYRSIGLLCKTAKNANRVYGLIKNIVDVRLIKGGIDDGGRGWNPAPTEGGGGVELVNGGADGGRGWNPAPTEGGVGEGDGGDSDTVGGGRGWNPAPTEGGGGNGDVGGDGVWRGGVKLVNGEADGGRNGGSVDADGLRGVSVMPVYLAKGLEFDAVLICDASESVYKGEDDRRMLYIACTRALHRLDLYCIGRQIKI